MKDDKTAFFEKLYSLDSRSFSSESDVADNLDDSNRPHFSANRASREQPQPQRPHTQHKGRDRLEHQLQHRQTAPPNSFSSSSSTSDIYSNNNQLNAQPAPLRRASTLPIDISSTSKMPKRRRDESDPPPFTSATTNANTKKQKRGTGGAKTSKSPPLQPLSKQIFKDLTFYFIKPDEKRPERKMRIDKAREYGATITFEFTPSVTHIIADKDLKYTHVLQFLKLDKIPDAIAVTNPRWPGDCIKYSKLVNPTDFWYQVPGCPEENQFRAAPAKITSSPPPTASSSASSSLQVQPRPVSKNVDTPVPTPEQENSPVNPPVETKPEEPSQKDALDEAIEECLAFEDEEVINIEDYLDDEPDETTATSPHASDPESPTTPPSKRTRTTTKSADWQSNFQCMHKHDGKEGSQNPNSRTIRILEEMMKVYDSLRDQWRTRSYRAAITTLKKTQDRQITTYESAISLPGIGDRLAKKIVEIATTDRLQRLEYAKLDPQDQILKLFHGIYGVGLVQARKFVAAGYKSLAEVKEHATLTEAQRIGVERYDDFKQRIPREEVAEHGAVVADMLKDIDEKVVSYVMGSYRRGAADCGDIDIIITKEGANVEELHDVLEKMVEKLFEKEFLVCGLAIARHDDGTKWHGASQIGEGKPWRRIDFLVVPGDEIGAAVLYFTGNDIFNRSMRLLASKKGMRLNQRGLWRDVMRGKNREKFNEGTLVESKDEKKIFEILGVPYRPPEHRIC
ncbi:hypothetical protein TWF694_001115 [Orbilia ellipsospora]|uniref:DNA polymerase lambda n=1 Tax=Orbilia ellipsospora TaxID=2528407 RepID=A0AAV9XQM8_9PEZI